MRPSHVTTFVISFFFKMFSQQRFSLKFRHFLVLFTLQLNGTYTTRLQHHKRNQRRWNPVAKQDSDIANSVAESLSNVVEKSLHTSSKESPAKLSMVQRTAEPAAPSSSNGNYYYYYDEGGKKSQRSRKKSKHKS